MAQLVARLTGGQEAVSSSLATPTRKRDKTKSFISLIILLKRDLNSLTSQNYARQVLRSQVKERDSVTSLATPTRKRDKTKSFISLIILLKRDLNSLTSQNYARQVLRSQVKERDSVTNLATPTI